MFLFVPQRFEVFYSGHCGCKRMDPLVGVFFFVCVYVCWLLPSLFTSCVVLDSQLTFTPVTGVIVFIELIIATVWVDIKTRSHYIYGHMFALSNLNCQQTCLRVSLGSFLLYNKYINKPSA